MDFTDRGLRQPQPTNSSNSSEQTPAQPPASGKKLGKLRKLKDHRLLNITYVTLLFSITVLLVGITVLIFLFDGNNKQDKLVDTGKYQAVFLNGGQVYFGKVTDVNDKFISLADIYYLQVNQSVQPDSKQASNNFTLTKLGCELHRPQDVMVINQSQVIFWENLKDDNSQNTVPGGIKKLKETPQNCETQSQNNSSSNGSSNNSAKSSNNSAESSSNSTSSDSNTSNTSGQ